MPKYLRIVLALAGDSTTTSDLPFVTFTDFLVAAAAFLRGAAFLAAVFFVAFFLVAVFFFRAFGGAFFLVVSVFMVLAGLILMSLMEVQSPHGLLYTALARSTWARFRPSNIGGFTSGQQLLHASPKPNAA